jgi:hypothetical protein
MHYTRCTLYCTHYTGAFHESSPYPQPNQRRQVSVTRIV